MVERINEFKTFYVLNRFYLMDMLPDNCKGLFTVNHMYIRKMWREQK